MKHSLVFVLIMYFMFSGFNLFSQCVNNPSIQQAAINPSPLTGSTGVYQFSYFENLQDYTGWQTDPITLTICMLNISPQNGTASVSGSFHQNFNWVYDPSSNCLQGTQNQDIFGGSGGLISVAFDVDNAIACPNNQLGFNANIQPPACMNGINETVDDTESVYTCYVPQATCNNNPSLGQASISPTPLTGSTGQFQFTYAENLQDYTAWQTDPITLLICMNNISPQNGTTSISGSFHQNFNWTYDAASYCFEGTQNQDILGGSSGLIVVDFNVDNAIACPNNQMGFAAGINPPACMTGNNLPGDDNLSVYTCMYMQPTPNTKCRGKIRVSKANGTHQFSLNGYPVNVYTYNWDFGDGNTSTASSPVHMYTQPGRYVVELTIVDANNGLCTFRKKLRANFSGGSPVAELKQGFAFEDSDLLLAPNPTSQSVTVQIDSRQTDVATLQIMNIQGKTVYSQSLQLNSHQQSVDLELSELPSGVYFVVLQTGNDIITKKLVKE